MNKTNETNDVESNHLKNSRALFMALTIILLGILISLFDGFFLLGLLIGMIGIVFGIATSTQVSFRKISQVVLTIAVLGFLLGLLGRIIKGGYGDVGLLVDVIAFFSGVTVFLIMTFRKKKEKGRLMTVLAVILSLIGLIVVGGDLDGRGGDFGSYQQRNCRICLHGLANSLDLYRIDFKGKNPSDLKVLTEYEDVPLRILTCRATKDYEDRYKDSRFWYVYRGNDLDKTSPDGLIVLHDRLGTHPNGRNVLFSMADRSLDNFIQTDDVVKWLSEDEFQAAIKKDNELRQKIGLPKKDIQGNVITP